MIARASPDDAPPAGGSGSSAQDAIAARLAKAKEYQAKAKEASKNQGTRAELEETLRQAQERLEEAKKAPTPPPGQKQQVRVKIVTKDNNYNPFDDDERIVGYEEGQTVYKPDTGGWGGDNEFAPSEEQKSMLTSAADASAVSAWTTTAAWARSRSRARSSPTTSSGRWWAGTPRTRTAPRRRISPR